MFWVLVRVALGLGLLCVRLVLLRLCGRAGGAVRGCAGALLTLFLYAVVLVYKDDKGLQRSDARQYAPLTKKKHL